MKAVLPKHLTDVEAIELIWGPPKIIRREMDFRDYQKWMVDCIVDRKGVFLAAEMGLGKTAATLLAIRRLLDRGMVRNVLIVAPLYVAEETWPTEIAGWDFARSITYRVVTGSEEERKAALKYGPCDVTIINRENLVWLYNLYGPLRWPFDMVVYDEATRLKSGRFKSAARVVNGVRKNTNASTELGVLVKARRKIKYVVELSGTPTPKGLIDLWGPIYLIDQGKRLGVTLKSYKDRWFYEKKYGFGVTPFPHAEAEIMPRLTDVFFSLREEDYLKLPPLMTVDHIVDLDPLVMKRYKKFEREAAIWLRDGESDPEVIRAVNEGVLTNKLLQFANGSLYREDGTSIKVHDRKIDVLKSIIQEAEKRPVLVAYSFQFDKDAIKKAIPGVRIFGEGKNDVRDWNNGDIPVLLLHPASAGHGLNLQFGSNIMVWYGLTWSMELYWQFIKRLHRSGQASERVFLHRIIARGTADENVVKTLGKRQTDQNRITDAVRIRLMSALKEAA